MAHESSNSNPGPPRTTKDALFGVLNSLGVTIKALIGPMSPKIIAKEFPKYYQAIDPSLYTNRIINRLEFGDKAEDENEQWSVISYTAGTNNRTMTERTIDTRTERTSTERMRETNTRTEMETNTGTEMEIEPETNIQTSAAGNDTYVYAGSQFPTTLKTPIYVSDHSFKADFAKLNADGDSSTTIHTDALSSRMTGMKIV